MNILVIGSEGTIGRELVAALEARKGNIVYCADVHFIERERYYTVDINEYESLMAPFRRYPDTVYHLAAQVGRSASEVNQCHTLETNVIGTYNVCKYCYEYDARLVYAGTSESYGNMLD